MSLVIVIRESEEPFDLLALAARERDHGGCLTLRDVKFLRSYVSRDRRCTICLYDAPDAESVREAEREAGMPVTRVFSADAMEAETIEAMLAASE